MLRSLFDSSKIDNNLIENIYGPVYGSSEEIKSVAEYLAPLNFVKRKNQRN